MGDVVLNGATIGILTLVAGGFTGVIARLFFMVMSGKDKQIADRDKQLVDCERDKREDRERFDHVVAITQETQRIARENKEEAERAADIARQVAARLAERPASTTRRAPQG